MNDNIKKTVRDKYASIVNASEKKSCCCCDTPDYSSFNDDYTGQPGYEKAADLSLGCGIPTKFADIKEGDTVVDLGSGAGNDVFVARTLTGETGEVIGVDFTEEMISKAEKNRASLKYENVRFVYSDIENIKLSDDTADVVISNCVLNLVPDKRKAFSEIYRITKKGGHFCISDIVIEGVLPEAVRQSAEMYAGCVSGALEKDEYIGIIKGAGFDNIEVKLSRQIEIPDKELLKVLNKAEVKELRSSNAGIWSITVKGMK